MSIRELATGSNKIRLILYNCRIARYKYTEAQALTPTLVQITRDTLKTKTRKNWMSPRIVSPDMPDFYKGWKYEEMPFKHSVKEPEYTAKVEIVGSKGLNRVKLREIADTVAGGNPTIVKRRFTGAIDCEANRNIIQFYRTVEEQWCKDVVRPSRNRTPRLFARENNEQRQRIDLILEAIIPYDDVLVKLTYDCAFATLREPFTRAKFSTSTEKFIK